MELAVSIVALLITSGILRRRIPFSFVSPVYVLMGAYLVILIGGTFLYNPAYGGASVSLFMSEAESTAMIAEVLWLLCVFGIGAAVLKPARRQRGHEGIRRTMTADHRVRRLSDFRAVGALLVAICSLLLVLAGAGWENVYSRAGYMTETNHIAKVIGYALLPVGVIALGAASTNRNGLFRCAAIALAMASLVLTLALNTRMFCLVPILFFGGAFMIQQNRKWLKVAVVVSIIAAPCLMTIPLAGRSLATQGVSAFPDLVYELSQRDLETSVHEILNNVFVSAPITTQSIRAKVNNNLDYIVVAVNPLPGFMTEWQSSQRKINRATPFNAVGDLLRGSVLIGMFYYALLGAYFARIDRQMKSTSRPPISLFALMALSYLFAIMTLQYPLRNCTRLLYYMAAVEALVWLRAHGLHSRQRVATGERTRQLNSLSRFPDSAPL